MSANSQRRLVPYPLQKRNPHTHHQPPNFESDSVNENFSPLRTGARRKRKMKRMDCEPGEAGAPTPMVPPVRLPAILPTPCVAPSLPRGLCLPGPSVPSGPPRGLSLPGPSGVRGVGKKKKVPNSNG